MESSGTRQREAQRQEELPEQSLRDGKGLACQVDQNYQIEGRHRRERSHIIGKAFCAMLRCLHYPWDNKELGAGVISSRRLA